MKLTLDSGDDEALNRKDLHGLVQSIRSKFKVVASVCSYTEDHGEAAIAVAALGKSENQLSKLLDSIGDYCEQSGYGRITSEEALLDHVDALLEE